LLSAFEVYLFYITGKKDIVVGLSAAGQLGTGNFGLVGHCINLLPIRSKIDPEATFIDYLKKRKSAFFDAYDNQSLTFSELIRKLKIKRDNTRVPLVPVVFNVDRSLDNSVTFDGLTFQLIHDKKEFETFDIFLSVNDSRNSFVFEWNYNAQIFKETTITRMINEFNALLKSIVNEPAKKIKDLFESRKPVLLPVSINPYCKITDTVVDLFTRQVKKFPQKRRLYPVQTNSPIRS